MISAQGRKPKPPTARDRKRQETERRLLTAARKLFSEYGYQNTAITEIAKVAGVTHALIHAYFNSKAGLLYALLSETNARQDRRVAETVNEPGTFRDRLRRVVTVWAEHDLADPALQAEMQAYSWVWPRETEADNERQLAHGFKSLHAALDMAIAEGEIGSEVDKHVMIDALLAIYTHGLRPAVFKDATTAECVELMLSRMELVLRGVSVVRADHPRPGTG